MSAKTPSRTHQEALANYLDELLREDPAPAEPPREAEDSAAGPARVPDPVASKLPDATRWSEVTMVPEPEPEPEPGVALSCGRILPDDQRYYRFVVGGLNLAIPAVRVSAELSPKGAFAGPPDALVRTLSPAPGSPLPVIDLARLMLPPSAPALQRPLAERATILVVLDEGQWAVSAEGAGSLESLDVEQVCWRGDQSARAWLAGTVAERRLALLDLDALAGMLP